MHQNSRKCYWSGGKGTWQLNGDGGVGGGDGANDFPQGFRHCCFAAGKTRPEIGC